MDKFDSQTTIIEMAEFFFLILSIMMTIDNCVCSTKTISQYFTILSNFMFITIKLLAAAKLIDLQMIEPLYSTN
ncbi:hypothetical protein DERP_001164 [Dermatophagoides pteronyssinus]|uniref:Uncharacterized protein n=1 Tax=Dermatophagoides pteronyssinus TaxID=6956 RepID=A0ABQ8JDV2_DERPT|nr:hypothetical protein DERP_001164 [Dermatophagoides pteronyssinus]